MNKIYTTGQIAKLCDVAPRTVSKWFDDGLLNGYKLPGSLDRRVPREDLKAFLRAGNMKTQLAALEREETYTILLVGLDADTEGKVRETLSKDKGFAYLSTQSLFEAGMMAGTSLEPNAVVVDLRVGRADAIMVAWSLHHNSRFHQTLVVGLAGEDDPDVGALTGDGGFNWVLQKPVDAAAVADRVGKLAANFRDD